MRKRNVLLALGLVSAFLGLLYWFSNNVGDETDDELDLGLGALTETDLERIRQSRWNK